MATSTSTSSTSPITMGGSPASAGSAPLAPSPTPPASRRLDLYDGGTAMGWIDGPAIGFRGFADEHEAAHAAWLAYRTMSRRFAREGGRRPLPIDTEPLALGRDGDVEVILAAGRPIAKLVRPEPAGPGGHDSFGFELETPVPAPADELTVRSTANLLYRTLRRSGIRWAMWMPEPQQVATADAATAGDRAPATVGPAPALPRPAAGEGGATVHREDASHILGTVLVILAMLAVVMLPTITAATVVPLLGTVAGLVALAGLGSLVHVVASDVRDSLRGPRTPRREARRAARRRDDEPLPAATRVAA